MNNIDKKETKQKPVVKLSGFCYTFDNLLSTKILAHKLARHSLLSGQNFKASNPNFSDLSFGETLGKSDLFHLANQFTEFADTSISKLVKFLLVHSCAISTLTLLNFFRGLSFLHLTKARLAAKAKLLASTLTSLLVGYGASQKIRVKYVFIFQRTLHLFWYKYSKLTNLCQNCVLKLRKSTLIYQHKIDTNLSYRVCVPLFYNTPLTKNGVMLLTK
jgi:hypothetical protein